MVRRLTLMGSPVGLAEQIAHRAFRRVARDWEALDDPLGVVRRPSLDELLARYRPPGRGPTLSPPREGAPAEWHAVGAILDPLSPEERVARVLQVYDGLDDPADHEPAPPVDIGLAELFADAVADVSPASRLTDLITNRDADDGDGLGRAAPTARRWSMPASGPALAGWGGRRVRDRRRAGRTPSTPTSSPARAGARRCRPDSARPVGRWSRPPSAPPQSSCPSADPTIGPGGTPLPDEGVDRAPPGGAGPRHRPARPRGPPPGRPRRPDHRPRRARAADADRTASGGSATSTAARTTRSRS